MSRGLRCLVYWPVLRNPSFLIQTGLWKDNCRVILKRTVGIKQEQFREKVKNKMNVFPSEGSCRSSLSSHCEDRWDFVIGKRRIMQVALFKGISWILNGTTRSSPAIY